MKAIVNTKLIMEDGIIWDGALTYENEKITQVGWAKEVTIPDDAEVYDAQGHSSCTAEAIRNVAHYGVKVRTHITDADQPKGRAQGPPGAGGDEYCLYNPDMYAELICDETGIHVPPDLIKMIVRTKGYEKICLISDSMPSRTNYKNKRSYWDVI